MLVENLFLDPHGRLITVSQELSLMYSPLTAIFLHCKNHSSLSTGNGNQNRQCKLSTTNVHLQPFGGATTGSHYTAQAGLELCDLVLRPSSYNLATAVITDLRHQA